MQDQGVVRARRQIWRRSSGGREGKRGNWVAIEREREGGGDFDRRC